ncbi:MAG: 30S ribosomal protein S4 [Deltaproteobacteria bacterium RBG_16_47_11]|nr:MAG: 30S ribosomal protein S4 [Deltaproteobacteria bacterium RBG_16_47_11]
MARYTQSVCRLCRRENLKLFLKGERCYTEKCAVDRRNYAPGQHGQSRKKVSDYGAQLREKQKVRRIYGLLENQFRNIFKKADQQKGITGETLLHLLERRLDNIVYRLGFANSRNEARQLVLHSHFLVNHSKVNIPSYLVKPGDAIELREKSKKVVRILEALEGVARRGVPQWLELDKDQMKGQMKALPTREDITIPIQEKLIVELYSK